MEVFINAFIDMFTTRDFAIITWMVVLLLVFLFNEKTSARTQAFLKTLASNMNNRIFVILSGYFVVLTLLFYYLSTKFGDWDVYLVKDAALWFLFSGLPINLKYIKEKEYFGQLKDTILDNFKVALLFDCVFNTYTFGYVVELVNVLIIIALGWNLSFTEDKEEYKQVNLITKKVLTTLGFLVILYVLYMSWTHHAEVFSKLTITELCLPFFYTCFFILSAVVLKFLFESAESFKKLKNCTWFSPKLLLYIKFKLLSLCGFDYHQLNKVLEYFAQNENLFNPVNTKKEFDELIINFNIEDILDGEEEEEDYSCTTHNEEGIGYYFSKITKSIEHLDIIHFFMKRNEHAVKRICEKTFKVTTTWFL